MGIDCTDYNLLDLLLGKMENDNFHLISILYYVWEGEGGGKGKATAISLTG
jgi:hypothetical protein